MRDAEVAAPLQPIRRTPVYEQVADSLRDLIEAEQLVPGERLPGERTLAALLKVSRSSVRQGLTVLRVMGLVEIRHGTGVYLLRPANDVIPPISQSTVEDGADLPAFNEVREVLESHAAKMAARNRTPEDLAALSSTLAEMEAEIVAGEDGSAADRRFHAGLIAAAGNSVLSGLILGFEETIRRIARASLARPGQAPRSLATHRLILDAVARHDEGEASRLMREHLAVTGAMTTET